MPIARATLLARSVLIATLAASVGAGGCATAPPVHVPRTTVVLLPDEDGHVGAVSVTGGTGSQKIDQAYSFATVSGTHSSPSAVSLMGQDSVTKTYGALLKAQPRKPRSFILHFLLDKTVLTAESKALIPAVMEAIQKRKPTEISIFGHADSTGPEQHNVTLSAERAKVIANLLQKDDPGLDHIQVQFFGDREPLFPAAPGVPEPRNRRVEVMIL